MNKEEFIKMTERYLDSLEAKALQSDTYFMERNKLYIEYQQLEEIEKEHQRINGELREEIKEYQKELEKADSITQSCIFNGKKESEISYRKALNELEKTNKENQELKDRIDKVGKAIESEIKETKKNNDLVTHCLSIQDLIDEKERFLDLLKGDKE